ncbi:MAG: hypothetical protein ACI9N9_002925, partial [Enterobacterales bacterium]
DCYRDYLVFMSLIRDAVRSKQLKVYGFCWLKGQSLMLIQPENVTLGKSLLVLLKRYHFWILQRGPRTTEFKLQIAKLTETSAVLDCLRFLHQRAVNEKVVDDAMDYHWHSHHVYSGFWSVNWLSTNYILDKFAVNRLVAMNRFRQYMLHGYRLNFDRLLEIDDCSVDYIAAASKESLSAAEQSVAEVNSHYHQSLMERTQVCISTIDNHHVIRIKVHEKTYLRVVEG